MGTLRTFTFVGKERLPREVIFFLDPRTLASAMMACRHFQVVIRKLASAVVQVCKFIKHGCWNAAARHRTVFNTCHLRVAG